MSFLRKLFGLAPKVDCKELLKNGAVLVDVRTPSEYNSGNVKDSKNIPLNTLGSKVKSIENWKKPIVLVCASGMRSTQATSLLKSKGVEAYNGGTWRKY